MGRSKAPMWVGFGAAAFIVLAAGNKWATDQLIERLDDLGWLRSLLQAQWLLTADGRPFDLYLVTNSFVVVYLVTLFVLLRVTLPRVDGPFVALTTAWGATVAAGLIGGLARGLLAEVTDNPFFATPSRDPNLFDTIVASADFAAAFAVWSGLIVGVAAAVAMAVTSSSDASGPAFVPSMPGAVQPPPPMPTPGPMQPPPPMPGAAGDPPSPAAPPPGSF